MSLIPVFFLLLSAITSCFGEQDSGTLPQEFPAVITESCPSAEELETIRSGALNQVEVLVTDIIANQPPCPCNVPGLWTRIAHLNTSDPDEQCPPNWTLITDPVRGCARSTLNSSATDSAIFPANGKTYSRVCDKIIALQQGIPDAFAPSTVFGNQLDGHYVDGISLTHGAAGTRQHIWTFVVARDETETSDNFACNFPQKIRHHE